MSLMSPLFKTLQVAVAVGAVLAVSTPVRAAESVNLVQGPDFSITSLDIQADSLRMPQEMRSIVLSKPQTITQVASNLYARRSMAKEAEKDALDKDPVVAAALQVARDKVLSDAWLEKMDKANEPTPEAAESMARAIYKAKPDRFKAEAQVRARHILIAGTDDAAKAQAEKLLTDLKAGADFAKLATEHSADKGSAAKGGDLGFFGRGKMVPEFDSAVFALANAGDMTGVVQTKFGFHIIQLQEKKAAHLRNFDDVKSELMKEVSENVKHESREAQAQKMQQGVTFNQEAIANTAASYSSTNKVGGSAATQPTSPKGLPAK